MSEFRLSNRFVLTFIAYIITYIILTSFVFAFPVLSSNIQCMPVLIISGSAGYGKLLSNNKNLAVVDTS